MAKYMYKVLVVGRIVNIDIILLHAVVLQEREF